jgi:hypothetical protein
MGREGPKQGQMLLKKCPKQELPSKCTKGPIYRKLVCCQVTGLRLNVGHAFDRIDACVRSYTLCSNANNRHGT